jgi:hypoxanthine phosphoribosyltransferase
MGYDRVVVSADEIQGVVSGMAEKISCAYEGTDKLVVVVLLEGARPFARDLVGQLKVPVEVVYVKASSYKGKVSSGTVDIEKEADLHKRLGGHDVLIVDELYDSGRTLDSVEKSLAEHEPKSMKLCVLLEKKVEHKVDLDVDFVGLMIEDFFAIGYGLDHNEEYRELPFIAEYCDG